MATRQANAKASQSIKINGLLEIPKEESNNSKQSNNNKFGSFKTLEESISFILRQQQLDNINDLVQIPAI